MTGNRPAKPNLFILGAPKCGTTALAFYLGQHPGVFMSDPKEPHFYTTDLPGLRLTETRADYEALFADVQPQHRVIGEASTWHLYSQQAVPAIERDHPEAKYIVMLRRPIDLIHALHSQAVYSFYDDVTDFARAVALEPDRAAGRHVPRICKEPAVLQYTRVGRLGEQVQRLFETVPRERVQVIVYDDLRADTGAVYRQTLDFLGLPDDGREAFPAVNASKQRRLRRLNTLLGRPPEPVKQAVRRVGLFHLAKGCKDLIQRASVKPTQRDPIPDELRAQLHESYRADTRLLGRLIGRDLETLWQPSGAGASQAGPPAAATPAPRVTT